MPLPDASKKSPRVYTLLQNTDLDNVTFANVQAVGNPIAIEEANEDEMRRLVLVNLCRLVTSGEWTGLLTSGGGGEQAYQIPSAVLGATGQFKYWNIGTQWAGCGGTGVSAQNLSAESQFFNPFIAPQTGAPVGVSITVNSGTTDQNLYVSFYDSSDEGYPSTLLGFATIDTDSTGSVRVTSFTEPSAGTLTFTAGTQYYFGINKSGTETPNLIFMNGDEQVAIVPDNVVAGTANQERGIESVDTTVIAPADIADTTVIQGTGAGGNTRLCVWLDF